MPKEVKPLTEAQRLKAALKEAKTLKKNFLVLTQNIASYLKLIDLEMRKPSTVERGKRIAELNNDLEFANDRARYIHLGIDYRKDKKK